MCLLIEKARKDYDVVVTMRTLNCVGSATLLPIIKIRLH